MTYGNSFETMMADQKFKLQQSDDTIRDFFTDCIGNINSCTEWERLR
jgi:hypothetical protein